MSHASGPGPSGPPLGPSLRAALGSPAVVREVPSSPRSRVWLVERAHRGQADYLARLPDGDWHWGPATARERLLHRLTVTAVLAADDQALAGLAQVSRAMRDRIRRRWPDVRPLPEASGDPIAASGLDVSG